MIVNHCFIGHFLQNYQAAIQPIILSLLFEPRQPSFKVFKKFNFCIHITTIAFYKTKFTFLFFFWLHILGSKEDNVKKELHPYIAKKVLYKEYCYAYYCEKRVLQSQYFKEKNQGGKCKAPCDFEQEQLKLVQYRKNRN